jgi:hypothetical protein
MASATFEDHPTDPDKVILRKKPYLDKGRDYEEGFVDGMQHQMQSSVDKAVNRMAQPEQEPVAYLCENAVGHKYFRWKKPSSTYKPIALYTTPPQRTWVGLTDEEIADCAEKMEASDPTDSFWREFFRGIEAKLKEKNA